MLVSKSLNMAMARRQSREWYPFFVYFLVLQHTRDVNHRLKLKVLRCILSCFLSLFLVLLLLLGKRCACPNLETNLETNLEYWCEHTFCANKNFFEPHTGTWTACPAHCLFVFGRLLRGHQKTPFPNDHAAAGAPEDGFSGQEKGEGGLLLPFVKQQRTYCGPDAARCGHVPHAHARLLWRKLHLRRAYGKPTRTLYCGFAQRRYAWALDVLYVCCVAVFAVGRSLFAQTPRRSPGRCFAFHNTSWIGLGSHPAAVAKAVVVEGSRQPRSRVPKHPSVRSKVVGRLAACWRRL